jgi:hypothetical protein
LVKSINPSEFVEGENLVPNNNITNSVDLNDVQKYVMMDFKRNKDNVSFQKTINLVTGLIGELEMKAKRIKARKKVAAI